MKAEPLNLHLAQLAGEAFAGMPERVSIVDAVVMASAAQRGDIIYASDIPDRQQLQERFPNGLLFRA